MSLKYNDKSRSDMPEHDVTLDMSRMSLNQRAKLAALVEADGDQALRDHLLGAIGRQETTRVGRRGARELPSTWTQIHVLDRLEEAFEVLAAQPMATRPKQYGNAMPTVVRQQLSHKDWLDLYYSGELELQQDQQNRVRLRLTAGQISRADQALRWPFDFLPNMPEVSRSVCQKALWSTQKVDIARRCNARGINQKFFNRQWQHGLTIIATRLVMNKVPVS